MDKPLRVLIAEDTAEDLALLLFELRRSGYLPTWEQVGTPDALSAALDQQAWDVMLLDASFSPVSALIASAILQERSLDLPILLIADTTNEAVAAAARQVGAANYVVKDHLERLGPTIEHELCEAGLRAERRVGEAALQTAKEKLVGWGNKFEQLTREIALLGDMSRQLKTCLTPEEAYTTISDFAQLIFPGGVGALYMLSPSQNLVEAVATWGEAASRQSEPVFAPDDCWALRSGQMHLVEEMRTGMLCRHVRSTGAGESASYLCVPLMEQGSSLGVLYLWQSHPLPESASENGSSQPEAAQERLTEGKQYLALTAAEHITLALANLKLREAVRNQAIRDPLTGLFNRRYLEETLERELRRADRGHHSLGVIMLDLDHFKRFNQTFGHEAGDKFMQAVGHFLQTHIRGEDVACRYREDEFALVLPEASLEAARERAKQIRDAIQRLNVQHSGQSLSPVGLSLGVASFPENGSTGEDILQAASNYLVRPVEAPSRLNVGSLSLNALTFEVSLPDKTVRLTPVEFELLYFLMSHPGQVFTAEQLLREVWQYPPATGSPELVRVHIKNLRGKIEPDPKHPCYLRTIGRFGYTIRAEEDSP
jgi:diguanylate cyclase (GGDEF)-like protein